MVDEAPLLQEAMHTQDGPHVSSQVAPAGRHAEVLLRVQAINRSCWRVVGRTSDYFSTPVLVERFYYVLI